MLNKESGLQGPERGSPTWRDKVFLYAVALLFEMLGGKISFKPREVYGASEFMKFADGIQKIADPDKNEKISDNAFKTFCAGWESETATGGK